MIHEYREKLLVILRKCGMSLASAWDSMDTEKRKQVLKSAFPNIPERKRPNCESLRLDDKTNYLDVQHETMFISFACPYMNIESLIQRNTLLARFHHLAADSQCAFAPTILEDAHVNLLRFEEPKHLQGHKMYLGYATGAYAYGQIIPITDPESYDCVAIGKGKLILDTQLIQYSFMVKAVANIIPDYKAMAKALDSKPHSTMEGHDLNDEDEWPSLEQEASRAPYLPSDDLNISKLCTVIAGHHFQVKQHRLDLERNLGYSIASLKDIET